MGHGVWSYRSNHCWRIGWFVIIATERETDLERRINLRLLSPALVQSLVREAVQR